jgi:hypothetical protein
MADICIAWVGFMKGRIFCAARINSFEVEDRIREIDSV